MVENKTKRNFKHFAIMFGVGLCFGWLAFLGYQMVVSGEGIDCNSTYYPLTIIKYNTKDLYLNDKTSEAYVTICDDEDLKLYFEPNSAKINGEIYKGRVQDESLNASNCDEMYVNIYRYINIFGCKSKSYPGTDSNSYNESYSLATIKRASKGHYLEVSVPSKKYSSKLSPKDVIFSGTTTLYVEDWIFELLFNKYFAPTDNDYFKKIN